MSGAKQATRAESNRTRLLDRVLFVELPAWQLLLLAAIVGLAWAASLFDWGFVAGTDAFWQFPQGTITGADNDMAQVLVGYLYYVQSSWHLPLFYVPALGTPTGTDIIFVDVLPIVALIGKLVYSVFGASFNLYGAYLFLCFVLPGVMMALALIAAGIRYAAAAVVGAIFADTMPALLFRWGHMALLSHYLLVGALALYLFSLRRPGWRGHGPVWTGYLILAYLTNIYLFVMVGTVWLCGLIQRRLNRLSTTRQALVSGVSTVALVTAVIALGGQFGGGGGLPFAGGYGRFSMNLFSPFEPQFSGVLPWFGRVVDANGMQYEGFNYLGLGLLLASLILLPTEIGWLRRNMRRHMALLAGFAVLTLFAVSNVVYAGHWLLFALPISKDLVALLGIFRSSGRFFWPIAYAQAAIVVVLGFRRRQPAIALCLVAAATIQLFDIQPLRARIVASIADGPGAVPLDRAAVERLLAGARHVEIVPSMQCADDWRQQRANMEVLLATAPANVPANSVYKSRDSYGLTLRDVVGAHSNPRALKEASRAQYCARELAGARRSLPLGDVLVLLSDQPGPPELAPKVSCIAISWTRFCRSAEK